MTVVLRRNHDRARAARLRREGIHRERVLREHRGASRCEEGERHQLEHVVRAVAEHDRVHVDVEARGERGLQLEAVAVRIAADFAERGVDRGTRARTDAERVLVGGQLDDRRFVP